MLYLLFFVIVVVFVLVKWKVPDALTIGMGIHLNIVGWLGLHFLSIEAISQLFGKLSLTLQRCNAMMLASRHQDSDFVPPEIDNIMWFFDISIVNCQLFVIHVSSLSIKQHAYGFLDRFPASLACGRAGGLGTPTNGFLTMVTLDTTPTVNHIPSADCKRVYLFNDWYSMQTQITK